MSGPPPSLALVLGAGGVTGIAWEIGLLAGLAEQGFDLVDRAELIVGTSAGATVAAQVTGPRSLAALLQDQIAGTGAPEPTVDIDVEALMGELEEIASQHPDPREAARRIGALALERDRVPESERRDLIAARLPSHEWPRRPLLITAVSTTTGEREVFSATSGPSLLDAVTASCAIPGVWPPVSWNGDRFMDGGVHSPVNADLVTGHDVVVVLAPWGVSPEQPVELLGPGTLVQLTPDARAGGSMQAMLDPGARSAAAQAGVDQSAAATVSLTAALG